MKHLANLFRLLLLRQRFLLHYFKFASLLLEKRDFASPSPDMSGSPSRGRTRQAVTLQFIFRLLRKSFVASPKGIGSESRGFVCQLTDELPDFPIEWFGLREKRRFWCIVIILVVVEK